MEKFKGFIRLQGTVCVILLCIVETIPVILDSIFRHVNGRGSHWGQDLDPSPLLAGSRPEGITVPQSVSMCDVEERPDYNLLLAGQSPK